MLRELLTKFSISSNKTPDKTRNTRNILQHNEVIYNKLTATSYSMDKN
jgi:hypothetical protein